jgi:hypothetical protein
MSAQEVAMIRTQVQLTEEQAQVLRQAAAAEHISMAEVIRRAIDEWRSRRGSAPPAELRRRALAVPSFDMGADDVAERHDRYWDSA